MKIGIVCLNLSWQAGGVRLIYSMAHALKRKGNTVVIYAPEFNKDVYPDLYPGLDIRVIPAPQAIAWQYKSNGVFGRVFEKMARERAIHAAVQALAHGMDADLDIVNLHDFSYSAAPFYRHRNPHAKILWTMNDPPYSYLPKRNFLYDRLSRLFNVYREFSEKKYFKAIDRAVVLVKRNKAWAEERGIRGSVVWSGMDFDQFYAPLKTIRGKSHYTLLGVGALNPYRRFEDIVRAVKLLRDKQHDVKCTIVCKNIYKEDRYRDELIALANEQGVTEYIDFRFDGVGDKELVELYAKSDFLILPVHVPSPRNGFGWQLVIFEAMAAGTPTIVCNTNDVTEAVKDGETALVIDATSPRQIADQVAACIANPDRYEHIAKAGQEFVKKNISWDTYAEEFLTCASS